MNFSSFKRAFNNIGPLAIAPAYILPTQFSCGASELCASSCFNLMKENPFYLLLTGDKFLP